MPGHKPSFTNTSLWQTPHACTRMLTSPASGSGISRSTIWKPAPGLEIWATFMVATATVVAINPPLNLSDIVEKQPSHFLAERLTLLAARLSHLENDFQFDRGAERKACDAVHQAARVLFLSENLLQQLRSGVSDFRLIADISRCGHRHAEAYDPRHFVERSQMLPRNSEDIECSEVSRLAPRPHVELRADAPNEFRPAAFRRKHAGEKKQLAGLNCFHIGAERLGWHGELDAELFQPLLGAFRPRMFAGYKCCGLRSCTHVYLLLQIASDSDRTGGDTGEHVTVTNTTARPDCPALPTRRTLGRHE